MNPAQVRLAADEQRLRALAAAHPEAIRVVQAVGAPPTAFEVELRCRGAAAPAASGVVLRTSHLVRITLPAGYPIRRPTARVLTPVFNPHVFASGVVCLGSEWSPAQSLDLFVRRLWQILVWDPAVIDPGSPADGGAIAWYEAHPNLVPFDRTDPADAGEPPPAPPAAPASRIAWNG